MQRVVIIGATGSGKTTLAQQLGKKIDLPFTDLDDLYWLPNWTERPRDAFIQQVTETIVADRWIMAGNYGKTRELVWGRADMIIWLDYPFWFVFGRLLKRSFLRSIDRKPICNGNYESVRLLLSRKSILLWLLQTYGRKKRDYGAMFDDPELYPNARKVRLRSPAETAAFVHKTLSMKS